LALRAFRRDGVIKLTQTMAIVKSILYAASHLGSVMAQSDQSASPDDLNDTLSALQDLLLPGTENAKEAQAERAMRMMEEEIKKGPFKVEGMVYNKNKRTR